MMLPLLWTVNHSLVEDSHRRRRGMNADADLCDAHGVLKSHLQK